VWLGDCDVTDVLKLGLCAAASAGVLCGAAARAAETTATDASQVQEIVVTAQKREQKEIDVPITLTAYTGAFLQKIGVQDLHDLSLRTPGFFLQNQSVNDPGLVMRGITTDSTDPTNEPRVSIYQDGVSISQVPASAVELFDIERVEVAKGPQTTLFGRAALTGAVNIIQNKASEAGFDWNLHVEGGNYNYGYGEGMVNIPIGDTFAIRISGVDKVRDGYIKNLAGGDALNGTSTKAARVALNYHPDSRLSDDLILNYEHDDPSPVDFKNTTFDPSNATTGQVLGDTNPFSAAALSSTPALDNNRHYGIQREIQGVTNILTYRIAPAFKLTSTTAWRHYTSEEIYDPDGFSFPILTGSDNNTGSEYSQDFRLNYDSGGKFSAFGGVSAFGDYGRQTNGFIINEPVTLALLTGVLNRTNPVAGPISAYTSTPLVAAELQGLAGAYGVALPGAEALGIANNFNQNNFEQDKVTSQTLSYDAYLDGTYRFTDKFEVSAGVRYTTDDKKTFNAAEVGNRSVLGGVIAALSQPAATRNAILGALAAPGAANIPVSAAYPIPLFGILYQPTAGNGDKDKAALSDDGFSWRLTGRYAFTPDLDVYATYARGRRPEVLASNGASAPYGATKFSDVASETLDDYEGGVKARLFDRKLSVDGAIYYNQYNHFSTTIFQNNQFVTVDAGNATTYGFEGQATWAATDMSDLFATYTYTHGRFDNGILKGNQFRLTPEHVVTFGASLRHREYGGVFDLIPSFRYSTKQFFNDDNGNPAIFKEEGLFVQPLQNNQYQKDYGVLDLRLSYAPDGAHWKIEGFVTNLTNTKFLKDSGNTGLDIGLPTDIPGEPRFYGVSFTIRK
jgi:outer membrane receptor protein involved in Fe transport